MEQAGPGLKDISDLHIHYVDQPADFRSVLDKLIAEARKVDPAKGAPLGKRILNFTQLHDLLAESAEPASYVWDQTLIAGGLALIAAKPKVSALYRGVKEQKFARTGGGKKGDPFLYQHSSFAESHSYERPRDADQQPTQGPPLASRDRREL
jgi:hypothetical protein